MQHSYPCRIRAMHPDDLDPLLAVQAQCYPPPMQEAAAVLLARIRAAGPAGAVAEDDEGLCAYLFAYPSRMGKVTPLGGAFELADDADTLYLHDLAVAPRVHGRGLARRLVEHVLARGRARGLAWSALVSVQDTARFWEGLGYRRAAPIDAAARAALAGYPGRASYMWRALTGPGAPSPNC